MIQNTSQRKEVLCIIGNIDPEIEEYPFISLEDILMRDGVTKVIRLLGDEHLLQDQKTIYSFKRDIFIDVSLETVQKYLLYLDAKKIAPVILDFIEKIERVLQKKCDNNILIKLIIHICCMVERLMFGEYSAPDDIETNTSDLLNAIIKNKAILENAFHIQITFGECKFISEIFQNEQ